MIHQLLPWRERCGGDAEVAVVVMKVVMVAGVATAGICSCTANSHLQ